MALLPTPVTGRLLRWTAGGTLENVTISDLLDQIAAGTAPNPATQKYWIDTSGLTQIGIWPPGVAFTLTANAPTVAGQRIAAIAAPAAPMVLTTAVPTVVGQVIGSAAISAPAASLALTPTAPALRLTAALAAPAAPFTLTTAVPTVSTATSKDIAAPAVSMTLTTAVPTVVGTGAASSNTVAAPAAGSTVYSPITFSGTGTAGDTVEVWDSFDLGPVNLGTTSTTTETATLTTAAAIPSGALVVLLYNGWQSPTTNPASANLTFTRRIQSDVGAPRAEIWTASAAADIASGEVVTTTCTAEQPRFTLIYFKGAATDFSVSGYAGSASATHTITLNAGTANGYVVAADAVTGADGGTPGSGVTEIYDGGNVNVGGVWHLVSTTKATGNITVSGTWGNANRYRLAALLIKQAT